MGEEVATIEVGAAPVNGSVPGDGMETGEAAGIEQPAGEAMTGGVGLRGRIARGVIVNSAFQIGLAGLGLFRTVAIAGFLTASEFGLWGLIITTVMTLSWLKQIGVGDKYQQQDEPDQVTAFQKAFTLELGYSLLWWGLIALALPLYASIYGQPGIIVPGLLLTLCLPLSAFETPIWIAYRQMRFVRQRTLMAVDQVTAAVTMIVCAIAGLGYWSLVIGALAGSAAGAVAAVVTCPYPIRLRFDRATLRGYYNYSWPLVLSNVSSLVVVQGSIIAGNATVGLAGVGAIAIAGNFTRFIGRVETIIKSTMYPAACRVKDRTDVLLEAFVKSNLLGLMWALPFGFGLAVFAPDLVRFVLGASWRPAQPMLELLGVSVALGTIGYSWYVFFSAIGNTRPFAVAGASQVLAFLLATLPLMILMGVKGFGYGYLISTLVQLVIRGHYLSRLFDGFSMFRHVGRAIAPTIPPIVAVLVVRALHGPEGSAGAALAMLGLYVALTVVSTAILERSFLAEIVAYLRGGSRPPIPRVPEREALAS